MNDSTQSHLRTARAGQTAAVMVALTTAGAYLSIPLPISPVPIVLQNMFVVLTGIVLVPGWALGAMGAYLLLGGIGLPLFAGGTGGIAAFLGPTGGYLVSYPLAAVLTSAAIRVGAGDRVPGEVAMIRLIGAIAVGFLVVYPLGIIRLGAILETGLRETVAIGVLPFLAGDLLKAIALVLLVRGVPRSVWRSLS